MTEENTGEEEEIEEEEEEMEEEERWREKVSKHLLWHLLCKPCGFESFCVFQRVRLYTR